jgi:hypothetical protein
MHAMHAMHALHCNDAMMQRHASYDGLDRIPRLAIYT